MAHGPYVLRYLRTPASPTKPPANRYTVVAGKKCGGSVQRNRLKRVTREALRALHPQLTPGFDCVVILRGTVEELPSSAAALDLLTTIFQRAGMLGQPTTPAPAAQPAPPSTPQAPS